MKEAGQFCRMITCIWKFHLLNLRYLPNTYTNLLYSVHLLCTVLYVLYLIDIVVL